MGDVVVPTLAVVAQKLSSRKDAQYLVSSLMVLKESRALRMNEYLGEPVVV